MHFHEWKILYVDSNFTEVYGSISSVNGLKAITWTNDDPIHWCIYVALRGDELTRLLHKDHWPIIVPEGDDMILFIHDFDQRNAVFPPCISHTMWKCDSGHTD